MKFSVSCNDLLNAVNKVISVTPARSTLPLLGNIYFSLEGDQLTLIGTDLEVYIKFKLQVKGNADGNAALPAKRLESLLENLQGKDLNFDLQPGFKLIIKTKGGKWTVTGEDPSEFPMPETVEPVHQIKLSQQLLADYLPKVIHAASTDELRRSMNGVYFEIRDNEFRMVSTDGHRLVRVIRKGFPYSGENLSMLVPVKTCNLMHRLFRAVQKEAGDSSEVVINFTDDFLICNYAGLTITSRLIDDSFPNYESVIPTDNEKILKVNKNELTGSLKRSIIMSDQITNRTTLSIRENELKIRSSNTEFGTDSDETIPCNFTEKDEFEIAFNGKYLIEAMQHFDSQDLIFDFNSPLKAATIRPSEQDENEDLMMLVMPVRNL